MLNNLTPEHARVLLDYRVAKRALVAADNEQMTAAVAYLEDCDRHSAEGKAYRKAQAAYQEKRGPFNTALANLVKQIEQSSESITDDELQAVIDHAALTE